MPKLRDKMFDRLFPGNIWLRRCCTISGPTDRIKQMQSEVDASAANLKRYGTAGDHSAVVRLIEHEYASDPIVNNLLGLYIAAVKRKPEQVR